MFPLKLRKEFLLPPFIALISLAFSLLFLTTISLHLFNNTRVGDFGLIQAWNIWDAPHYLDIAQNWYRNEGTEANFIAFLPFFPALLAGIRFLTHADLLFLGFFISIISSISLSIVFYQLVKIDQSKKVAISSLLLLFSFPTSFFLFIPYPESVFLLLCLSTFLCMRKDKILLASIFALFATATKIAGLALIPVIFVELFLAYRESNKPIPFLKTALALNLPILGFLFYLWVNFTSFGDPLYFSAAQQANWSVKFSPVITGFKQAFDFIFYPELSISLYMGTAQIVAFLLGLTTTIYSYFRLRKSYFVFSLGLLFIYSSMSYWMSMPRFILSMFPLFIMLARFSDNRLFLIFSILISLTFLFIFGTIALEYGPIF